MAIITTDNAVLGISQGVTWGAAVAATTRLRASNLVIDKQVNILRSRAHDTGNRIKSLCYGAETVGMTFTTPITFGNAWWMLLATLFSDQSTPAEQNVGEGDYLSTFDLTGLNDKFITVAFLLENDVVVECPSVKLDSMSLAFTPNDRGTATFTGIVSNYIHTGTTTSAAALNALTHEQAEQEICFNTTNTYLRYGNYSTGTPLSSSNDLKITGFNMDVQRPLARRYALRGANTPSTLEPLTAGQTQVTGQIRTSAFDDSEVDFITDQDNKTAKMIEVFDDGDQIGAGDNNSLKIQIPSLKITQVSGVGIDGPSVLQQPTANFEAYVAAAAPAGMAGVTDLRFTSTDERTTAWIS